MQLTRRDLLVAGVAALTTGAAAVAAQGDGMYGLIGKMTAVDGKRDELIAILLDGVSGMPGCLSYVVATDPAGASAVWITEAWDSKALDDASLALPAVKAAIGRGRPLIAAFSYGTVTTPVGGHGLAAVK